MYSFGYRLFDPTDKDTAEIMETRKYLIMGISSEQKLPKEFPQICRDFQEPAIAKFTKMNGEYWWKTNHDFVRADKYLLCCSIPNSDNNVELVPRIVCNNATCEYYDDSYCLKKKSGKKCKDIKIKYEI